MRVYGSIIGDSDRYHIIYFFDQRYRSLRYAMPIAFFQLISDIDRYGVRCPLFFVRAACSVAISVRV